MRLLLETKHRIQNPREFTVDVREVDRVRLDAEQESADAGALCIVMHQTGRRLVVFDQADLERLLAGVAAAAA